MISLNSLKTEGHETSTLEFGMAAEKSQKLHIAFYCSLMRWPRPSHGGVRQWTAALANDLVARGHRVDVLVEAPRERFVDEPLLADAVGRVVLETGFRARVALVRYARRSPGLRLVAALNRYNLSAALLKPLLGRETHLTLTQHENLSADAAWKPARKYRATTLGVRLLFNRADAVVAVSHGVANDLQERWGVDGNRLHVIHNPAFDPAIVRRALRPAPHPWLQDKTTPVIMGAGRLHRVKGFDVLLEALADLRARVPARLIIVGEGPERPALEAAVVRFGLTGWVALPGRVADVAPWFARADVFALPSHREGFGNVLVEALAVGLPVVASRCPSGPDEILEDGRWGQLVPVADCRALAIALERALREPRPDPARLQQRAAMFTVERAVDQYLSIWHGKSPGQGNPVFQTQGEVS